MQRSLLSRVQQSCRPSVVQKRFLATTVNDPRKTRNMALVAHIDSGKTTLTESILLATSYLSTAGSVDTGSTTTDFLPAERERGITIQSASIPTKWNGWNLNLIDTPGHADFGMEVESASRVVDGAVVLIDAVEGVEAQTKGVWKQLNRYGVPTRMMFLNKLDRPGASFRSSLQSILAHRIHPNPLPLILPIASFDPSNYARAEPGVEGLVDLVKWEVWKWEGEQPSRHPLPDNAEELEKTSLFPSTHPLVPELIPARTALLENLSMFSEDLMTQLLELPSGPSSYLSIKTSDILPHLRACTLRNDILPVLCGSAMKNVGTDLVLDYAGELFADPLTVSIIPNPESGPVQLLAWKVSWDKRKGWMTFVRVYSGTLRRQTTLHNTTRNQKEKVSKILLLYASEAQEVDELPFGSVGVILGLKFTRTGDTLVATGKSQDDAMPISQIVPPLPVISTSVIPQSNSDAHPVQEALDSLSRTDPSVRVDSQEGQLLVHGLGALHLEIVERRLRDEWGVNFEFGKQRVSYREGLSPTTDEFVTGTWKTDVSGKPIELHLSLSMRPLAPEECGDEAWDGNLVVDSKGTPLPGPDASDRALPIVYVARGLATTLSNSPHSALGMSHLRIQIGKWSYPPGVNPSLLAGAAAFILRERIKEAGMGPIMEPYIRLRIAVHEESIGKIVKDLTENGGEVLDLEGSAVLGEDEVGGYSEDGVYIPPAWLSPSSSSHNGPTGSSHVTLKRSINAIAPLSRMLDYSNRLRALSGGHGTFEMSNAGFREVSDVRKLEILREIGRA